MSVEKNGIRTLLMTKVPIRVAPWFRINVEEFLQQRMRRRSWRQKVVDLRRIRE
jgi:hypothetical protein